MVTECYFRHSTNVRRHGARDKKTLESLAVIGHCNSIALARRSLAVLHDVLHGKLDLKVG
jgi:hypothetical protein